MTERVRLGVNIDHVATVRNARGGLHPDPVRAAEQALAAGADGITAHLREDRRHITDPDIEALSGLCARAGRPLNFEMALTQEMLDIALRHRPHAVCIVPERREERTTEGGLNMQVDIGPLFFAVQQLKEAGIRVSLFLDPTKHNAIAATGVGAHVVEFHTGRYCHAEGDARRAAFEELEAAVTTAHSVGLEVHAGHGLDYETAAEVATLPQIRELNIGHFLIGEAIFIGLDEAIARMRSAIDSAAR